jgi:hypothetical protein
MAVKSNNAVSVDREMLDTLCVCMSSATTEVEELAVKLSNAAREFTPGEGLIDGGDAERLQAAVEQICQSANYLMQKFKSATTVSQKLLGAYGDMQSRAKVDFATAQGNLMKQIQKVKSAS